MWRFQGAVVLRISESAVLISERDIRYSTEAMILFSRFTEGVPEDTSELPSHDDIPMVVKHSFVGFSSVNHASIDYDIHSICSTL